MTLSLFVRRQTLWLWLAVATGVGFVGCSRSSDVTSPKKQVKDTSPVIAQVGSLTITANEFRRRYKARKNKKQSPEDFLKVLKEEKLLLMAAREKKLQNSRTVHKAGEKMAVRLALKQGFEGFFRPSMIREEVLKEQYTRNPYEFNRPVLIRVVHLLARFPLRPRHNDKDLLKQEQKALPAIKARAKKLSEQMLATLKQLDVKTWKDFEKYGLEQMKKLNRPDERLQKWYTRFRASLKLKRTKASKDLWTRIKSHKYKLMKLPFCVYCADMLRDIDRFINGHENRQKFIKAKAIKQLLSRLNYRANGMMETVRYERLNGFPRKAQHPFPAMVEPFTKAAYALKNKTYSQLPIKTKFGYHIIFRVETSKAHHVPYAKARKRIRDAVYQAMKRKQFLRWTKLKYHEYKINVDLQRLRKISKLK